MEVMKVLHKGAVLYFTHVNFCNHSNAAMENLAHVLNMSQITFCYCVLNIRL